MALVTTPVFAKGFTKSIAAAGGLEARVLWCDAEANIWALDSREEVAQLADRCKEANINVIVLDVKPLAGVVLYKSRIAPRLKTWQNQPYPQDFDVLQAMVEEGHRVGIEVYASINVFSEGSTKRPEGGAALTNPDWQCIEYKLDRFVSINNSAPIPVDAVDAVPPQDKLAIISSDKVIPKNISADAICAVINSQNLAISLLTGQPPKKFNFPSDGYMLLGTGLAGEWLKTNASIGAKVNIEGKTKLVPVGRTNSEHFSIFVNPSNPSVQAYELSIVSEIISNYDVDGIMFDRMRYPGMFSDFSDLSRQQFEQWIGQKVEQFPEDIFTINPIPGRELIRGKHFAQWMEWRTTNTYNFLSEARRTIKSAKPQAKVAVYVGSWYDSYYDVGVNWASPRYQPPYDFASPTYKDKGFANLVDWMCTGCYYQRATKSEAIAAGQSDSATVEAAGEISNKVVDDDTFVYAGLYLLQYARDPVGFEKAIAACQASTQGVMLFDLVYIRDYNWWDILKRVFATPTKAPHTVDGLVDKAKEVRALIEAAERP